MGGQVSYNPLGSELFMNLPNFITIIRILLIPASLLLAAAGTLFLLRRMRIAPPDRIK